VKKKEHSLIEVSRMKKEKKKKIEFNSNEDVVRG
jgi:hypothetical protein